MSAAGHTYGGVRGRIALLVLVAAAAAVAVAWRALSEGESVAAATTAAELAPAETGGDLASIAARGLRLEQSDGLAPLRARVAEAVAAYPARVALAVIDLETGERFHINGADRHFAASLVKVFIGASVWREVEAGAIDLDAVRQDLFDALVVSSNIGARELLRRTSFAQAREEIALAGLGRTELTHAPGFEDDWAPAYAAAGNQISALDAVCYMANLWNGGAFERETGRRYLERWAPLADDVGLAGPISPFAQMHRKIGWLGRDPELEGVALDEEAVNDMAVIRFLQSGQEHAYAIAVLTEGNTAPLPAWRLVASVSKLVWDYFTLERYPPPA